jgi:hypothetical protein
VLSLSLSSVEREHTHIVNQPLVYLFSPAESDLFLFPELNELEKWKTCHRTAARTNLPPPSKLANFHVTGGFGATRQIGRSAHYEGRMDGPRLMCNQVDRPAAPRAVCYWRTCLQGWPHSVQCFVYTSCK